MMFSHPQSDPLLPKRLVPLPHPPQRDNKMIIQIMELHPHPLFEFTEVLHPHAVAVKSLICCLQKFFIYGLSYVAGLYVFTGCIIFSEYGFGH